MALGNSSVNKVDTCNENIKKAISYGNEQANCVYSTWNTFQYVAKNMSNWAEDTAIGAQIQTKLVQLSDSLYKLMNITNNLNTKVSNFVEKQRQLNGSNGMMR